MDFDQHSSARKRFLYKITQRSSKYYEERLSLNSNQSNLQRNPSITIKTPEVQTSSSPTASRSITPTILYKKPKTPVPNVDLKLFESFLRNLLNCKEKLSETLKKEAVQLSNELSENFSKNSELSLKFYMKMNEILSFVSDHDMKISEIRETIEECLKIIENSSGDSKELKTLNECVSMINLKVITTVKRLLNKEPVQSLSFAYLVLVSGIDSEVGVKSCHKLVSSLVFSVMQRYTLKPGNFIQTCRKLPNCIKNSEVAEISIKYCEEIFSKVTISSLKDIDKTRVLLHLYRLIQAALDYYQSLYKPQVFKTAETSSTSSLSLTPAQSSSNFSIMNGFSSQSSSYEYLLDQRFHEFLKSYHFPDLQDISSRLRILDDFLLNIRDDLRTCILPTLNPIFEKTRLYK